MESESNFRYVVLASNMEESRSEVLTSRFRLPLDPVECPYCCPASFLERGCGAGPSLIVIFLLLSYRPSSISLPSSIWCLYARSLQTTCSGRFVLFKDKFVYLVLAIKINMATIPLFNP